MKLRKFAFFAIIMTAVAVAGCSKKSSDQASLSGTGFDSLTSTEELAQLPQAGTATQQSAVEVLPIETSPVTQSLPSTGLPALAETVSAGAETLSQPQKIQLALKNAGLYSGNIDGKIGPASKRAIETFQKNNGLTVDGKVGPKTWAALEPYLNSAAPAAATTEFTQQ